MPVQFSTKISNLGNIILGLRKLGPAAETATRHDVYETMEEVHQEYLGGEPGGYSVPERNGQLYERTGALGAGMYVVQDGATSRLEVEAGYAVYVIGGADGEGQAWMHQGRWPNLRELVERIFNDRLIVRVNESLTRVIRELGLGL